MRHPVLYSLMLIIGSSALTFGAISTYWYVVNQSRVISVAHEPASDAQCPRLMPIPNGYDKYKKRQEFRMIES